MNDTDKYILDAIKVQVWSGFSDESNVQSMIDDILEEDADEEFLRAQVAPEFQRKAMAESSWPEVTDCDRLDRAFESLNAKGIIALHNAGYTMSDGQSDVGEVLDQRGFDHCQGYCFYHGQDMERAIKGGGLMLAFGDLKDNKAPKAEIGNIVMAALKANGLRVEWNGDSETRINLPDIDWKRRRIE